jgi:ADP-ribose pyrophosphatase YjhB (NUDIX family)
MISFNVDAHRFHYRAAAIVLHQGCVLLHRLEGDCFWALPGGRVNAGETAADAIAREFGEELGVPIACGALACTGENFFDDRGVPHHEIGLYFHATLPIDSPLLNQHITHIGTEGDKRLEFRWFAVQDLRSVDFRPAALKDGLVAGQLPQHFVQRG